MNNKPWFKAAVKKARYNIFELSEGGIIFRCELKNEQDITMYGSVTYPKKYISAAEYTMLSDKVITKVLLNYGLNTIKCK